MYISGTLGGAVFKLPGTSGTCVMMPTDFCSDMSNGSEDIAIHDKFQNGGHVLQPILAKLTSSDSA